MPSREENKANWATFDWSLGGDDWSTGWGSSRMLWYGTILPRIHFLLPARHLLEIAPGYGRVTAHLLEHCQLYTGVDITPRCIDACKERFADQDKASFHLNDGASLEVLEDASLDVAISWDSLVHADPEVLEAYVQALARKLEPGGRAFLHHSNLGALSDSKEPVENPHWRDERMSGALMRRYCKDAGMALDGQQIVQWGSKIHNDCFTWLRRPREGEEPVQGELLVHPHFDAEVAHSGWLFRYPGREQA